MTLEELLGDEKEFQFLIGKVEPNQKLLVYIPRMGLPSQFLIGKVEQLGIIGIEAVLKTVAGAQFLIGKV